MTGASSGIGKGICQILAREGAVVSGTGRNEAALQDLRTSGTLTGYVVADLTQPGECQRVVTTTMELLGVDRPLTTVVNAAGVLQGGAVGSPSTYLANYEFNMKINTQVPFEIIMHAVPYLKKACESSSSPGRCTASIVNISSVNGKQSFAGCATYCMSKAALDQLTRCASVDLAPYGIRVNGINPGVIETNLQRTGGMSASAYAAFLQKSRDVTHPIAAALGRVGQAQEIGEVVAFLVSDKAAFLTGETIAVDGGRQNLGAR